MTQLKNALLRTLQFIALVSTGLSAGVALAHLLELPNKRLLGAQDYLLVQQHLYEGFGRVIGPIETVALISAATCAALLLRQHISFVLTLLAVATFIAAQVIWQLHNGPVNEVVATWTAASLPPDWTSYRDRWELAHAARAGFYTVGLGLLSLSVLVEAWRIGSAATRDDATRERTITAP